MSTPEPPARHAAGLADAPEGFKLICSCSYVTQVLIEVGPDFSGVTEIAITCHGCKTPHWVTLTLRKRVTQ